MEWNLSWISVFPRLPGNFQLLTLLFSLNKIELVLHSIKKRKKKKKSGERAKTQKMSSFIKAWQIPSLLNLIRSTLIFPVWNFLVPTPLVQISPTGLAGGAPVYTKIKVLVFWHESCSLHFWNNDVEKWSSEKNLILGFSGCQITLSFSSPAGGTQQHSTTLC